MAITNYLVHFKTSATFNTNKSQLRNDAVAFVRDATIIHTHGTDYYCGSGPVALKSDLANYATTSALTSGLAGKANTSHTHTASQVSGLANVATSGSYNDLSDKPSIPSLSNYATKSWVEEQGYLTSVSWSNVSGKPDTFTPAAHTHVFEDITFKNTGDSTRYLAGNGFFYKIQYNEIDGIPDLSRYLTQADLSNYVTEHELSNEISSITPSSIGAASSSHTHGTDDITKLTGYTEGSSTTTLSSSMTLNAALASLQNQIQTKAATSDLSGYATQSWVNTQLDNYLPLSGGTLTGTVYFDHAVVNTLQVDDSMSMGSLTIRDDGSDSLSINGNSVLTSDNWSDHITSTDTKNTTGTSDSASKLYLAGGTTQSSAGVQTYSNSAVYTQSGQLYATRMNATNGFYETSDARLKDFKEDIKALDTVDKIPTKYFTWKDDENKESQIGTSAQAIQESYPELVSKTKDDTLTVDYAKLSIIALAAIKELKTEIQFLKEEIKQLKSK